jgi:tetratricopeptide (TPR) repeat protein
MRTIWSTSKIFLIGIHYFSGASHRTKDMPPNSASALKPVEATNRHTLRGAVICVVATIASLAPFANKAFHIDDILFLYAGRQICAHPADPYGFKVNWSGSAMPMAEEATNPPLTSYYIALVASCIGWSETALHLAFLVPAVAAVLGTYFLALRFCTEPLLAALATLLCPVFLISSTTLMCDTMMLALVVWAVVLWLRSAEDGSHVFALLSAGLIAAATLTKYFAASFIPLLLVYSLLRWPRVKWRVLYLALPVAVFLVYDFAMHSRYGQSPLYGVGSYAMVTHGGNRWQFRRFLGRGIVTLSFAGGCLATVLFYAPLLWSRRVLAVGLLGMGLMVWVLYGPRGFLLQLSVFVVGGVSLVALAIVDFWHARDAESALLVLWMLGTLVFCWLINWTVNGRTILPMAPAASILIVRRLDRYAKDTVGRPFFLKFGPLVLVAFLAAAVTWADTRWADSIRVAAGKLRDQYGLQKNTLRFTGHWGFQYYMESYGFKHLDSVRDRLLPGGVVVVSNFSSEPLSLPQDTFSKSVAIELASCPYLATMRREIRAGFYAAGYGELPFAVGPATKECCQVMTVAHACELNPLIKHCQEELKQHPDSADLLGNLGNALFSVDRMSEAREYLERAVQRNSPDAVTYSHLAWLLATREPAQGGDPPRAVTMAERGCALMDNPSYACLDTLAVAYAAAGRFPEAITAVQKALALASAAGETLSAKQIEARLRLYHEHRAYRAPSQPPIHHEP